MSINFGLQVQEVTVPNRVDLCGTSPYNATTSPYNSINITFPGTPPFEVHSTLYAFGQASARCAWHRLPTNLTSNTFIWTPAAEGRRPTPEVLGNQNDYRIIITDGDSLVWIAKELQGDLSDPDAENKAYVSGNHTMISPVLAAQRAAEASNDALPSTLPLSFKACALVGMLAIAMMSL